MDHAVDEEFARDLFEAAILQNRCGELLACLWSGGSAAIGGGGELVCNDGPGSST